MQKQNDSHKTPKGTRITEGPMADHDNIYDTNRAKGVLFALAGMALLWATLHTITFSGGVFSVLTPTEYDIAWIINSLLMLLAFCVLLITSSKTSTLLSQKRFLSLCMALMVVSLLLFLIGALMPRVSFALYIGSVFLTCSTAPLIVAWGELYSYLNPKGEQLLVTLAAIVLSVMIYYVEINIPDWLAALVVLVTGTSSIYCLGSAIKMLKASAGLYGMREKTPTTKSPALFLVCIIVLSIPMGYLRYAPGSMSAFGIGNEWEMILATAIIVMGAVAMAEVFAERQGYLLMPALIFLLQVGALITHMIDNAYAAFVSLVLIHTGYYLFLAMVYLGLGAIVATAKVNPVRLFSSAMVANVGGLILGFLLSLSWTWVNSDLLTALTLVLSCVVFALGIILLQSKSYSIFRVNSVDESAYSFELLGAPAFFGVKIPSESSSNSSTEDHPESDSSLLNAVILHCAEVSSAYHLSARESTVLVELARGKTIASIAKDLIVSENTIKAHTKSIYRKLNIHTREELIALVEKQAR